MTSLAVTMALVELDTVAVRVVVATIGSGDVELGVVVMFAIVATVMGVIETVVLLCIGPSRDGRLRNDSQFSMTF